MRMYPGEIIGNKENKVNERYLSRKFIKNTFEKEDTNQIKRKSRKTVTVWVKTVTVWAYILVVEEN